MDIILTVDDRTKYDGYTKGQVYEAYMLEVAKSERLTSLVHRLERHIAKIRYEVNK